MTFWASLVFLGLLAVVIFVPDWVDRRSDGKRRDPTTGITYRRSAQLHAPAPGSIKRKRPVPDCTCSWCRSARNLAAERFNDTGRPDLAITVAQFYDPIMYASDTYKAAPPEPAVGDFTSDIEAALEAEERRQNPAEPAPMPRCVLCRTGRH